MAVGDCGARGVSRGLLGTPYYQSLVGGVSESHKHGVKIHFKCTSVTEEQVSVPPAYIMEKITGHGARTAQRSEVTLV